MVTVQEHAIALARKAAQDAELAAKDLERGDRIDALDTLEDARLAIWQAMNVIRATLPSPEEVESCNSK